MNGIIEKQGTPLNPPSCKTYKPTIMERRLAENCVAEIERLSETGVTVEQVERLFRALAVLQS